MACCLTWPADNVASVVAAVAVEAADRVDESVVFVCKADAEIPSIGVGVDVLEGCFDPVVAAFAAESVDSAAEERKEEKMLVIESTCCTFACCDESCACSCACTCACPCCCPWDVVSAGGPTIEGMATSDFRLRVFMDENR